MAVEPMIAAPVAISFDENGRLFVVEMPGYRDRGNSAPRHGRVRALQDLDETGVPQTSTIYADGLTSPSAVACYAGGVFVAAGREIIYLKDTKGDGVADVKRVVFSGFGSENAPSVQRLLNNFNCGPDNRIHAATAGLGGLVVSSEFPGNPLSLDGSDFSFDPRTLKITVETGPAQSGLSFDSQGRKFVCDFDHPLRVAIYESRYAARNPFYPRAPGMAEVISPAAPLYPSGATAVSPPRSPSNTNAATAAWFTEARGCVVCRGGEFPSNYWGNVFVADANARVVHRVVLRDFGLGLKGERAPDEKSTEFLTSSDPNFHPVQLVNGPNGALYAVDTQDGRDRGRVYRITPERTKPTKPVELRKAKTHDLVAALAGNDGWRSDAAARLLFEIRDPAAGPLLTDMLNGSHLPLARLHALHALDGMGALKEEHLIKGLGDADARVREHAVMLCERVITNQVISEAVWNQLKPLAGDAALRVRCQLAFTLGEISRPDRVLGLLEILRHDPGNAYVQNAVLSSLSQGAANFFSAIISDNRFLNDPVGLDLLKQLATMLGEQGHLGDVRQVGSVVMTRVSGRLQLYTLLNALADGLHRTRSSLALVDQNGSLKRFYGDAVNGAADNSLPELTRVEAVRLVGYSSLTYPEVGNWLWLLASVQSFPLLQSATVATLAGYDDPRVLPGFFERWRSLPPASRNRALGVMLGRNSQVSLVLEALEQGRFSVGDLSSAQANFLRTCRYGVAGDRAVRLLGPVSSRRPEVVDRFKPALRLKGVVERGRQTFMGRCAGCHKFAETGQTLGPDLTACGARGREKVLGAILEPNLEVASEYATSVIATAEGENLVGIKIHEDQATVTLRQLGGATAVWPRLNIESEDLPGWSLMPEGLEQGLSAQDMADLIEFLVNPPR